MRLILQLVLVAGFLVPMLLGPGAGSASAKQCIWNKSGSLLKARWYDPGDFVTVSDANGGTGFALKRGTWPLQVDDWQVEQRRCTRDPHQNKQLLVVLSVVGGKLPPGFMTIDMSALARLDKTGRCGAPGVACKLAGAGAIDASGADVVAVPDARSVFWIGIPGTSHYLDIRGSVWRLTTGRGGPIN